LITGSSRGIGRTLPAGLADAGATVVLNGMHEAALQDAQASFWERYGPDRVFARVFDVTDELQIAEAVNWIEDEVGPIRIVINNAGIQHRLPLVELDLTNWEQVLRVNLTGAFLVGREVPGDLSRRWHDGGALTHGQVLGTLFNQSVDNRGAGA
jgi:gluconate 5-dehydrogenase